MTIMENKTIDNSRRNMLKAAGVIIAAAVGSGVSRKLGAVETSAEPGILSEGAQQQRIVRKAIFVPANCRISKQAASVNAKTLAKEKIEACNACVTICPRKAVTTKKLIPGTALDEPVLDEKLCIGCGRCIRVCPAEPKGWELWDMTNNKKLF